MGFNFWLIIKKIINVFLKKYFMVLKLFMVGKEFYGNNDPSNINKMLIILYWVSMSSGFGLCFFLVSWYIITWFRVESTVDLVWRSRQQVLKLEGLCSRIPLQLPDGKEDAVSTLNNKITSILSSIVTRYRLYKLNFCVHMYCKKLKIFLWWRRKALSSVALVL